MGRRNGCSLASLPQSSAQTCSVITSDKAQRRECSGTPCHTHTRARAHAHTQARAHTNFYVTPGAAWLRTGHRRWQLSRSRTLSVAAAAAHRASSRSTYGWPRSDTAKGRYLLCCTEAMTALPAAVLDTRSCVCARACVRGGSSEQKSTFHRDLRCPTLTVELNRRFRPDQTKTPKESIAVQCDNGHKALCPLSSPKDRS